MDLWGIIGWDAFKDDPECFDLVLTDMTMPGLTGDVLAKKMMALCSDLPIILCTGYNEKMSEQDAMGIKRFVLKLVLNQPIVQIIREVLDA